LFYVISNATRASGNGWSDDLLQEPNMFLAGAVPTDPGQRNRLLNYRRDIEIPKHRLRWNWIVDLPVGRGKRFAPWRRRVRRSGDRWLAACRIRKPPHYCSLPTSNWVQIGKVEVYGTKYPIED